jgi:hypothetical protein
LELFLLKEKISFAFDAGKTGVISGPGKHDDFFPALRQLER